jgi:hypothetical protein
MGGVFGLSMESTLRLALWQGAHVILDSLVQPASQFVPAFAEATGWHLRPEGACKGDVCIPLPATVRPVQSGAEVVDVSALATAMGLALVPGPDGPTGVSVLGPDSLGGRTMSSAEAPDLVLPTIDGDEFRLSSLRGSKVFIQSWAPY